MDALVRGRKQVYSTEILNHYRLYILCHEFGVLPCAGGVLNQPNRTMEIFELIAESINEKTQIEIDIAKRDARVAEMEQQRGR